MKISRIYLIVMFFLSFFLISSSEAETNGNNNMKCDTRGELEAMILKEAPKPDLKVFEIAEKAMDDYREFAKKAWNTQVVIKYDKNNGLIYTNWHRVHKGEVEWKIDIVIWGDIYRVDVWERSSLSFIKSPRKGYMCRLEEMRIQQYIDKKLENWK